MYSVVFLFKLLSEIMITIHVPSESISEFLPINLHIQSDGNQNFWLRGILMDYGRVVVIKATGGENSVRPGNTPVISVVIPIGFGTACTSTAYE